MTVWTLSQQSFVTFGNMSNSRPNKSIHPKNVETVILSTGLAPFIRVNVVTGGIISFVVYKLLTTIN